MLTRPATHPLRALALLGLAAVVSAGTALAADPGYLSAVSDLPLPPGLVEDADGGLNFDKPEGRIVEALARGAVAKTDVDAFYRAALPELGWKPLSADPSGSRWRRGEEKLSVDFVDDGNPLVVRFSLTPN